MKIAFIGQKGIPAQQGGIEKHVEELSTRLASLDFDVTVYSRPYYTGDRRQSYFQDGVRIINLPSIKSKNLDAISHTFIATIHALFGDYDIIHYHGVGPALLSFIPRLLKPSAKVIVTFHCIDSQHQKWNRFAKIMLALGERAACIFPHATIVVSQTLKKYCHYRFDRETTYLPNGVELKNFDETDILSELGLEKKKYFLTASRLVRHKGIHTLIEAYKNLATDKKLVIVGDGSATNDYVAEIKSLAKDDPRIIFAGQKLGADLATLFGNAYLFLQPSETEGLSIALLEAMSFGLPIIISNIEENQEAVENCALEFINKSPEDLRIKLQLAENQEETMLNLGAQAKLRVEQNYNWNDIVNNTVKLYQELMIDQKELVLKKIS